MLKDLSHNPLDALSLPLKAQKALSMGRIDTLEKLCSCGSGQLICLRGMGPVKNKKIEEELARVGLKLRPNNPYESERLLQLYKQRRRGRK